MQLKWYLEHECDLAVRPAFSGAFEEIYKLSKGQPCKDCNCQTGCAAWRILSAMSIRERAGEPARRAARDINQAADQLVTAGYTESAVRRQQIQALGIVFQADLSATTRMATEILESDLFRAACARAGVEPTRRQANKCLRNEGLVYETIQLMAQDGTLPTS